MLMATAKGLLGLLLLLGSGRVQVGTVFGSSSWDRSNPQSRLACYHREIDDDHDLLVAHNHLPCRSPVLLYNPRTGLATLARVGDRGPRGGGIDLSRLVARRLAHNGHEPVLVVRLPADTPAPAPARTPPRRATIVAWLETALR